MKIKLMALIILMTGMSVQGAATSRDLEVLINRENELRNKIVSLWLKTEELHKRIDATHARIECANKVTQIVVACGLVMLGGFTLQHLLKKYKCAREKKIKDSNIALDRIKKEKNVEEDKGKIDTRTTYFFVRHGQTDWNVQGKIQGHTDVPLNDTGRQQAIRLKKMLEDTHFSACFSSDLQRAVETAAIVIAGCSLEIVQESRLRERHYGDIEGKSLEECADLYASLEGRESLRKRIEAFLVDKAEQTGHQGNVLIVTHGGFISSVLALVLNHPFDAKSDIDITNTGYVQMYFSGSEWVIEKTEGITLPKPQ